MKTAHELFRFYGWALLATVGVTAATCASRLASHREPHREPAARLLLAASSGSDPERGTIGRVSDSRPTFASSCTIAATCLMARTW